MKFKLDENLGTRTQELFRAAGYIVVIRVPQNPSLELLKDLIESFITMLPNIRLEKQLLIVQPGRIRIYQPEKE